MSLGATITRYASALVVIAISLFGVASNNLYAVILQITAILLLPSISISQSLSICYSASANKTKEVSDCIKLNILYAGLILALIFLFLPEMLKIIFNYNINQEQIFDIKLATAILFLSSAFSSMSFPIARAVSFIKIPQAIDCVAAFLGLAIGKIFASDIFDFIYVISFIETIAGLIVLILTLWWKAPQFRQTHLKKTA